MDKVVAVRRALDETGVPHGFGGALALAWCTERARGTIDIDLNLFVPADDPTTALRALPDGVTWDDDIVVAARRDGQVRVVWESTPLDLFWSTTPFHERAGERTRIEAFGGASVPFLGCDDLAVFKAFLDRPKDWVDLQEMVAVGTLDLDRAVGVLVRHLGADDHRVERFLSLG